MAVLQDIYTYFNANSNKGCKSHLQPYIAFFIKPKQTENFPNVLSFCIKSVHTWRNQRLFPHS